MAGDHVSPASSRSKLALQQSDHQNLRFVAAQLTKWTVALLSSPHRSFELAGGC